MKRLLMVSGWLLLLGCVSMRGSSQSYEVQQLILDWEKLVQEKQILTDLYKGYQILNTGYTAIRDISKGSFDLHKAFLDGLLAVSPVVRDYKRVAEIISLQERTVAAYKSAWSRFREDTHFTPDEIVLIGNVYSGLFDQSVKNLASLVTILTAGSLRASDGERLHQIDGLYTDMEGKLTFLNSFNNSTELLSLSRAADQQDYEMVRQLYGMGN